MAAARSPSLGQQILHEELSCSICLELFTRPKVLPCQHTFCQDCLQVYFADSQDFLRCPDCLKKVSLPPDGVTGLPDNFSTAKLCESVRKHAEDLEKRAKAGNKCPSHPSAELRLYCTQCNVPVCYDCLEQSHNGHSMTTIKKATNEQKPVVQSLLAEGKSILGNYGSVLRDLRDEEKRLINQKKQTDRSIIEAYERTLKEFERTMIRLRSRVQEKHAENTEARLRQQEGLQREMDELSAACDTAEREMAEGGDIFLVNNDRLTQVVEKYRGVQPPPTLCTHVVAFHPKNFDNMEITLGKLTVGPPTSKGKGDRHGNQGQADRVTKL